MDAILITDQRNIRGRDGEGGDRLKLPKVVLMNLVVARP